MGAALLALALVFAPLGAIKFQDNDGGSYARAVVLVFVIATAMGILCLTYAGLWAFVNDRGHSTVHHAASSPVSPRSQRRGDSAQLVVPANSERGPSEVQIGRRPSGTATDTPGQLEFEVLV